MSKYIFLFSLISVVFVISSSSVWASTVYVSLSGSDANTGSFHNPVATIERAMAILRTEPFKASRLIKIDNGLWVLNNPITINEADSGISFEGSGRTFISGGVEVKWVNIRSDGLWVGHLDNEAGGACVQPTSLFVNGVRKKVARYPDYGFVNLIDLNDSRKGVQFSNNDRPVLMSGSSVRFVALKNWFAHKARVEHYVYESGAVFFKHTIGSAEAHFSLGKDVKAVRAYFENSIDFLDEPGEWFFDFENSSVLYKPSFGEDIDDVKAFVPCSRSLMIIDSDSSVVQDVHVSNIGFGYSAIDYPVDGYSDFQAGFYRTLERDVRRFSDAAIHVRRCSGCNFDSIVVSDTDGVGLVFGSGVKNSYVSNSTFVDVGGTCIMVGDKPKNAGVLERYWWDDDPDSVPASIALLNNNFERCGKVFISSVGVYVGIAKDVHIFHNYFRDLPYTGISIGWKWDEEPTPSGGHLVYGNVLVNTVNILGDGAAIYMVGYMNGTILERNLIYEVAPSFSGAENNGIYFDEGVFGVNAVDNYVFCSAQSPYRFHKAKRVRVEGGVVFPKSDISVFSGDYSPVFVDFGSVGVLNRSYFYCY